MRASCALVLIALLGLMGCATTQTQTPPPARFKILQINDVYKIEGLEGGQSGGLARVRALREYLESDGTPVLVLHAGDALYPSVMSKYLEARPMIDVLNRLDGDATKLDPHLVVTFGNHEFDNKDPKILNERLGESQFIWVSTNTRWCNPKCDQYFPNQTDILTLDVGGVKVGIVGLMYPLEKSYVQSTDAIHAARDAVNVLRGQERARVVIALTHQDMSDDVRLMQEVMGIDLVVGGHDHLFMQENVEGKWITKADADAKSVIVWDVTVPADSSLRTTPLRVVLDQNMRKDKAVDTVVQGWMGELSKKLGGNETIGMTRNLLEGVEPVIRGRESALGNLLTDVAREQMQTDVAVLNGGSIRINDNIPPGPVTKYDMEGIFYFANKLVAFKVTGQQLLDMLRNAVSRADAGDGRFLQVSGLTFSYHPTDGKYVVNAEDVRVGGKPLDVEASYTVASIDYLYTNGADDGFTLFAEASRPPKVNADREADYRTVVEKYLRDKGTVDVEIEGRIVRAP